MSKLRGQAALRPDFTTEISNCCEKKIVDFPELQNSYTFENSTALR